MQIDLLLLKRMLLAIVVFMGITLPSQGQIPLTIDKAMEIAQENSPSLRRSYMNLERYKQNLIAQKASLKSRFSLNLNPLDYNKNRRFDPPSSTASRSPRPCSATRRAKCWWKPVSP